MSRLPDFAASPALAWLVEGSGTGRKQLSHVSWLVNLEARYAVRSSWAQTGRLESEGLMARGLGGSVFMASGAHGEDTAAS